MPRLLFFCIFFHTSLDFLLYLETYEATRLDNSLGNRPIGLSFKINISFGDESPLAGF